MGTQKNRLNFISDFPMKVPKHLRVAHITTRNITWSVFCQWAEVTGFSKTVTLFNELMQN